MTGDLVRVSLDRVHTSTISRALPNSSISVLVMVYNEVGEGGGRRRLAKSCGAGKGIVVVYLHRMNGDKVLCACIGKGLI